MPTEKPEHKTCRVTGRPFTITDQVKKAYQRFDLPLPDIHPDERRRYSPAFYNVYILQWAKEARTGKKILTCLDPKEFPVIYDNTYWMSNDFDARDYGRDIDFSRQFFEQWKELYWSVPKANLTLVHCENCEYCNLIINCKDCYLCFNGANCEKIYYSARGSGSKESIELFNATECELCFHCVLSYKCYNVAFATFAYNCSNSRFLYDCTDCSDCYQCVNLKHKKFCYQNKQYSQKEYEALTAKIDLGSAEQLAKEKQKWQNFLANFPIRGQHNINCENSDGILLKNCQDCHHCISLSDSQNCYNCMASNAADSADSTVFWSQKTTFSQGVMKSTDVYCSWGCEFSYNLGYCMMVFNCHDLFGCYGLKKNQYCILNKQYSEAEYHKTRDNLVKHMKKTGEWGQWFPYWTSPFCYQDSAAAAVFPPLTDEMAKKLGVRPGTMETSTSQEKPNAVLPDNISETQDDVTTKIFECSTTQRPYKITKFELDLHRRLKIALPREHWRPRVERYYRYTFPYPFESKCAKCQKEMLSIENPALTQRPVWCDGCFAEMYI